ncbi:MAG: pantoate--beta-alanine ligase [Caulobacteraceae bacterium]|nr:pantoate--beta-alanine ligase [Caulobacteraceae bacterium]
MSDTSAPLPIVRSVGTLREQVRSWRREGQRLALVPTMGALHEGHLSLVRQAKAVADRVVASVFVNPTQFAPTEDLDRYPRQEARDAELLAGAGCDLLFAPPPTEVYPTGFSTSVTVSGVTDDLEGAARPQMFGGVALVVAKLFNMVQPHVAIFGEKDYQQLLVIRRMTQDLDFPIEILAGATVREADGLAMSSRNAYLSPTERAVAARLNLILREAGERVRGGQAVAEAEAEARDALIAAGFQKVDYVAFRDGETLAPTAGTPLETTKPDAARELHKNVRVLAAAWLGSTRLIDNLPV